MNQDPCIFAVLKRETVLDLAIISAVAAACVPATRLVGNIRCDDITCAVDERMRLVECCPGETLALNPMTLCCRRDWRDGFQAEEMFMDIFLHGHGLVGRWHAHRPLRADEVAGAIYRSLTNGQFQEDHHDINSPATPS